MFFGLARIEAFNAVSERSRLRIYTLSAYVYIINTFVIYRDLSTNLRYQER